MAHHLQPAVIKAKILIVDDDAVNIKILCQLLHEFDHQLLVAKSGEQALKLIKQVVPDLILLDIYMEQLTGIDVCRQIKADTRLEHIPVIFLTSSEADLEEAFAAGGVDYIVKPFKKEELLARVSTQLNMANLRNSLKLANEELGMMNVVLEEKVKQRTRDLVATNASLRKEIHERRYLQDRVDYLSRFDFVTRMFNRASMEERLEHFMSAMEPCCKLRAFFLYLDLDQFKVINDTCGHVAGDEILRALAELLKGSLGPEMVMARMGGDEFAFFYQKESEKQAVNQAQQIKKLIEEFHFAWENEVYQVGVSMGLVEIDNSFDGVNHLISIAERTCHESKMKGGGELSIYHVSKVDIEQKQQQMRWIPTIQQAIKNDDFFLCGQYIQAIDARYPSKMEVLIRLETPAHSVLPPGHFIPTAEKYHMISFIDRWVLANVLKQRALIDQGFQFSINLSGESISKESFADFAEKAISDAHIPGRQLCFEITETSAISNISSTRTFMKRIGKYGCEFSLDDFGTGTSSYGYLKELPVQYLKIDGIFIRNLESEKINRMMVKSITEISKEMGIKVIAECVENAPALAQLTSIGVDYAQGFHLHKPTRLSALSQQPA
ncbi:EAL domain-containing protein [Thalassomonas viridans]|uniref:EAL domain-containing protein n=1 Tax=Thalassomonas viridans TaxID=137584 RepID=A0AAF0C7P3_9GAMM|nr:EAL domain-containing protein [Thalassomonas viridans]WDE03375.1 EAL domain-containing protein [Thalassomonas viridans]